MPKQIGRPKGTKLVYFSRVKEVREALKERALELYEAYRDLAKEAQATGNLEVAEAILWKLIEHMPNEDGEGMVDISVDKPKQVEANKGSTVNIGFVLGGITPRKALPETAAIDVVPEETHEQ